MADLSPECRNAITAAAVGVLTAARAGVHGNTLDNLITATILDLRKTWADREAIFLVMVAFMAVLTRTGVQFADGWDSAASDTPATAYLREVGTLSAQAQG
jgi:hypothetical protein